MVHLLHWIEVLALTGNLGVGVYAMNDIEKWCNPHDRKGGGLVVLILDFSRETLFLCPSQIVFSHSSLMVKHHACRIRHEECQVSLTTLLNMLIQLGPSGRSFRL